MLFKKVAFFVMLSYLFSKNSTYHIYNELNLEMKSSIFKLLLRII